MVGMTRLVEFPVDDESSVIVEVDDPGSGTERVGRGEIAERASETFGDALDRVRPAAALLVEKLRTLADTPDEIAVEFGVKMSGKLGAAFIASAESEANFKVTLTWRKPSA